MQAPDPYAVLGVAPDATQAEISSAFRGLVRRHHPDLRNPAAGAIDDGAAGSDLDRVLGAYAVLRDPDRRSDHDRLRLRTAPPTAPAETAAQPGRRRSANQQPPIQAGPVVWRPVPLTPAPFCRPHHADMPGGRLLLGSQPEQVHLLLLAHNHMLEQVL